MTPLIRRITNLLDPLAEFYTAEGRPLPHVDQVNPDQLPKPERELLAHDRDMTSTLERFCGDALHLRVLQMHRTGDLLNRQVVLETDSSNRPVEFGAIQIHLNRFEVDPREEILACHRPLGSILAEYRVHYMSCPTAYFRIASDTMTCKALALTEDSLLSGRHNVLKDAEGSTLAEVVEILAPTGSWAEGAYDPAEQ